MTTETPQQRLGRLIRERREELGIKTWTQQYVADRAGVAQTTISAWEKGKRQNPRAVELSRVATALGLDLSAWLREAHEKPPGIATEGRG